MTPVSHDTIVLWWEIALALTVVVLLVVAVLLELVIRTTKRIHTVVHDIWFGGTRIAANTVTIALLRQTNVLAGEPFDAQRHGQNRDQQNRHDQDDGHAETVPELPPSHERVMRHVSPQSRSMSCSVAAGLPGASSSVFPP